MKKTKRIVALILVLTVLCSLCVMFASCSAGKAITDLQQQIEELKNQQTAQQNTINQQQDVIDELGKERDELASAVDELKKENAELINRVDELENEVKEQKYKRIKQAYVNFFLKDEYPDITADDATILYYVGEFSNCEVAMLEARHQAFLDAIYKVTIRGVQFIYPSSNVLYVCKNFNFYTLQQALDLGLISQQDLEDIGARYSELLDSPPEPI